MRFQEYVTHCFHTEYALMVPITSAYGVKNTTMITLAGDLLRVLAYFDLFDYPLTRQEICLFLHHGHAEEEVEEALQQLVSEQCIFRLDNFYALKNDPLRASKRTEGNDRASSLLRVAGRISAYLFHFPFVRAIGISGSLSKNHADEKSDIDYFIITKAGRLWIARTWMHLFKKLTFLSGRQHWYCMNYYIDEQSLQITEKNIFTAMETVTLIPMHGHDLFKAFFDANAWTARYFPGGKTLAATSENMAGKSFTKNMLEFLFDNRLGNRLDDYLMKVTTKRWQKKEQKRCLNIKGDVMGIKTGKHFCKPNPVFFQEKILTRYRYKLKELEERSGICLGEG